MSELNKRIIELRVEYFKDKSEIVLEQLSDLLLNNDCDILEV